MKLIGFNKVKDGTYLKNYELSYENKSGRIKKYEIVSRRELASVEDIGKKPSGVSIVAYSGEKMLLLHEFRMGINKTIYNLCAGMLEDDETIEECIARELHEETGLKVKNIISVLPPSYAAVAISDVSTYIAFIEAEGEFEDHSSENEEISGAFYSREEIEILLKTEFFSSRAQLCAWYFLNLPKPGGKKYDSES